MRKTLRNILISLILIFILTVQLVFALGYPFIQVFSAAATSQEKVAKLIFKNEKTSEDISYIQKSISITQQQSSRLAIFTRRLSAIMPLRPAVFITDTIATASLQLPHLLGEGQEANIVLLFLNNYELRPGGGFIGSLGFVTLKNYSITRFEVQDVYEIDGQITRHHEPHYAVRKYLNQPNEFLRDSNFSPDFGKNAQKILLHLSDLSAYDKVYVATIGITATAFEHLLRLTGPIELTDYNTTISGSNFFTTTQRKIETEFFPGSKQKRSILQSLGNVMRQRIEEIPPLGIFDYLSRSVKTKNLVLFSLNPQLQNLFVMLGSAGGQTSTHDDWVMPVDANVGVNKMDALVHKTMDLRLLQSDKIFTHTFKSIYTNTITADAAEKESYKNYFQLYTPNGALLKTALLNGMAVNDLVTTSQEGANTVFSVYFETPPATSTAVSLTYDLPHSSKTPRLHFQKQIGAKPSPLTVIYKGATTKVEQRLIESDEVFSFY